MTAITFQTRVQPWLLACFGAEIAADRSERNHRFLEESLELVQSCGCTASEAHQLVDYVFGRPVGEPAQEAGGVMVTLAALCLASSLDMHEAGETELARIWTKVEAIRAKQAAKPKHSPLPAAPTAPQDWRIDTSTGRGILVYKNCSVIEDADARYVLSLIAAASQPAAVAGPVLDVRAIAAAVCQRVAELPDRNSPEDWPEAILVTGQELIDVVTCELEQAQAAPALEAPAAPQQGLAIPDDCPHIIWFDDHEMQPVMFAGHGARAAALEKFKRISMQWNAHLFVRIGRNSRDDRFSVAALAAAPQAPAAPSVNRYCRLNMCVPTDAKHDPCCPGAADQAAAKGA